jgi:hypothetical protein
MPVPNRSFFPLAVPCVLTAILIGLPDAGRTAPAPKVRSSFTNSIGVKMVRIPASKYTRGSPGDEAFSDEMERPRHVVEISKPFHLSAFTVTQTIQKMMGTNPSTFRTGGRVLNLLHQRRGGPQVAGRPTIGYIAPPV